MATYKIVIKDNQKPINLVEEGLIYFSNTQTGNVLCRVFCWLATHSEFNPADMPRMKEETAVKALEALEQKEKICFVNNDTIKIL